MEDTLRNTFGKLQKELGKLAPNYKVMWKEADTSFPLPRVYVYREDTNKHIWGIKILVKDNLLFIPRNLAKIARICHGAFEKVMRENENQLKEVK